MDNNRFELTRLQEEFRQSYTKTENKRSDFIAREDFARRGGFFGKKRRKQLLGLMGQSGGRVGKNTKTHFRQEVRETVETALIDLLLFIRTAEDKDLHQVLNKETLEPIVKALFLSYSIRDFPEPNADRAKIALMFIEKSFEYLRKTSTLITSSQERMVEDAVSVGKQLTLLLVPESDRSAVLSSGTGI